MANKLDDYIKQIFIVSGEQKILNYLLTQDDWQMAKEIQKITALSKAAVHFALDKLFKLALIKKIRRVGLIFTELFPLILLLRLLNNSKF